MAFAEETGRACTVWDGDGTLWDVVMFPAKPLVDPGFPEVLRRLVRHTAATGLLTGRSYKQIEDFGLLVDGLHVVGQFGCEWYRHGKHELWQPPFPIAQSERVERLKRLLVEVGAPELQRNIEAVKSHFIAVHYPDSLSEKVLHKLRRKLEKLAGEWDSAYLPGHNVVEIGPRVSKETSLQKFILKLAASESLYPSMILYAGDSGPDLAAFAALDRFRVLGVPTLKVCTSDHAELCAQADLVVDGPQGTLALANELAELAERREAAF